MLHVQLSKTDLYATCMLIICGCYGYWCIYTKAIPNKSIFFSDYFILKDGPAGWKKEWHIDIKIIYNTYYVSVSFSLLSSCGPIIWPKYNTLLRCFCIKVIMNF